MTKLLDFGIAKLVDQEQLPQDGSMTLTGVLLGTAGYLAPEQIEGRSVDGRADLFSLGPILFEMVRGSGPLRGRRRFAGVATLFTHSGLSHTRA